ncbi:MAG: hypothetical protein CR980_01220 [Propionibacteriales bacterium]|nr:MAG: hypothetical protein CR980_01220 [Propionibacteriales bacterium]
MLAIPVGNPATLHLLGHIVDVALLPILHLDQRPIKLVGRVIGIHDLFLSAPSLGRSLLEQPK